MSAPASLRSPRSADHTAVVQRGEELHELRRYASALKHFRTAERLAPLCPVVAYNLANTLHMLGRDEEAYDLLKPLINSKVQTLAAGCQYGDARSVQLDAHMLLFLVIVYGRGFCSEAFSHAAKHLRLRRSGLKSVWSKRTVQKEIQVMRREWVQTKKHGRPKPVAAAR